MSSQPDDVPGRSVRVVLADDDERVLSALADLLGADPRFEVTAAVTDGHAAVRALGAKDVDVVIVDLHMPYGGPELVRRVRGEHPACAIVVFSADSAARNRALSAGASAFVHKGDPATDLKAVVVGAHVTRQLSSRQQSLQSRGCGAERVEDGS